MIVTAHIKFSIGTTFLDNFFTAEDERLPGESIEDGVLRVRSHLVKAVQILKKEAQDNGGETPLPDYSKYRHVDRFIPEVVKEVPTINKDFERMEIEIDNCSTIDALVKWEKGHDVLPGKIISHYKRRLSELGVND